METIEIKRKNIGPNSTTGEMYGPDGSFWCFTLEDPVRNVKIPGKTAIPAGTYELVVSWSNKNKRVMPRLLNVPFFDGILIHPGNTPEHSEGCVLIGRKLGQDAVYESVLAFEEIFTKIRKMVEHGEVFVKISGGFEAQHWVKKVEGAVS